MTESSPKQRTSLMSRRTLLRSAVLAGIVGAVARLAHLREPRAGLRKLDEHEAELVAHLGDILFPAGGVLGISARDVDIVTRVDDVLCEVLLPVSADGFRYLLRGLDYVSTFTHSTRFCACDLAKQTEILEAWGAEMPGKLGYESIRSVLSMAFFNHPAVLERVGFRPRCEQGKA